ncbi:MAG: carboxylating nicotinate-nucleotide diphosphorylase [Chlorobi bacterium]|nr:carboxylating nicotinate-nucleotide diphosphorylase [Chlorobiota bacterium]
MTDKLIDELIELAIKEDIGDGDHSSQSCIPETAAGKVKLLVKEEGIIAGIEIAEKVFKKIDSGIRMDIFIEDGTRVKPGDIAFTVEGKVLTLLKTERLILNVMQRMSGIATRTNEYVQKLEGLHTKVLDTRKTTPGMRVLEKMAVKIGGGENHRMGLYDMVMLKDNHIDFAGGIEKAVKKVHEYLKEKGKDLKIEVEVRNFDELNEVLRVGGIHRIMLDNFDIPQTKAAVELINGRYETESSGGITIETLRDYAECGVDYISVGALTHHIKSLDMSLKAL